MAPQHVNGRHWCAALTHGQLGVAKYDHFLTLLRVSLRKRLDPIKAVCFVVMLTVWGLDLTESACIEFDLRPGSVLPLGAYWGGGVRSDFKTRLFGLIRNLSRDGVNMQPEL